MKKTMGIIGGLLVVTGAGFGAWTLYKKYNPCSANDMENMIKEVKDDALNKIKM